MSNRLVGSRLYDELPEIRLKNVRWNPSFWGFKVPSIYNICGIKRSGKSMLNESIGLRHSKIVDLMASRDNESLCWLRDSSPIDDVLLVVGDNIDLDCSWEYKQISDLTLSDILDHEATVTCNSFYHNTEKKFMGITGIVNLFFERFSWDPNHLIYLLIRESNSFLYSRTKQGVKMKDAKADFIYFTREIRHFGCSSGIDLLRWTATDLDLRDNGEFTIFKQIGSKKLPNDKKWLYAYFNPYIFSRMKPWQFVLERVDGALGWGSKIEELKFHKEEGVNLLAELEIKIEKGEEIQEGTQNQIGDMEHEQIVRTYLDLGCSSMKQAAEKIQMFRADNKLLSTSTMHSHIGQHNKNIETIGYCNRCLRVGSGIETTIAKNPKYKRLTPKIPA